MTLSDSESAPSFQIDSFPKKNAFIATIQPPREPASHVHHVPCDIALVIDVSGSMDSAAPVPGDKDSEANGLSILDLVRHAALTIVETMDERDRLSIVTFASKAKVLQPLMTMTDENKKTARDNIKSMRPIDATNLWGGIKTGLEQFEGVDSNGKVPAIMVLTDGMPNHMCPAAGYIPKLRTKLPLPATIHTFGFGYDLRSGLLKSLAEIGNGSYSFIPDAGMIGTVFVHAVANLQNTYATEAELQIRYAPDTTIREAMGTTVLTSPPEPVSEPLSSLPELSSQMSTDSVISLPESITGPPRSGSQITIPLGNIQYGQSRDILLRFNSPHVNRLRGMDPGALPVIEASIKYKTVLGNDAGALSSATLHHNLLDESSLPAAQFAYHDSRAQICSFLSNLFPIQGQGEHQCFPLPMRNDMRSKLDTLAQSIPANEFPDDPLNKSLLQDLAGESPAGQITLALLHEHYLVRWGQHYLPSLLNAHTRQVCNSFKDPGPLMYGADAPLFVACRDRLDDAFDNLPAPEPSRTHYYQHNGGGGHAAPSRGPVTMSSYRMSSGVCFAGSTPVQLSSGRAVEIRRLRRGMKVQTPLGSRKVAAVLRTPVKDETLCRVGSVLVTPWHPVSVDGKAWTFPAYRADKAVRYTGSIYSIMLQRDRNPDAHALRFDGLWGVTLGHGVTNGGDARAHAFFGDYNTVGKSLMRLSVGLRGEFIGSGVGRDSESGLVCTFKPTESHARVQVSSPAVRGKTVLRTGF